MCVSLFFLVVVLLVLPLLLLLLMMMLCWLVILVGFQQHSACAALNFTIHYTIIAKIYSLHTQKKTVQSLLAKRLVISIPLITF